MQGVSRQIVQRQRVVESKCAKSIIGDDGARAVAGFLRRLKQQDNTAAFRTPRLIVTGQGQQDGHMTIVTAQMCLPR